MQVYHLASVRMRDLCEKLDIDAELCSQMWTCFEHCLMKHIELIKDRHIDQIVMCSIYVLAKVSFLLHVCSSEAHRFSGSNAGMKI